MRAFKPIVLSGLALILLAGCALGMHPEADQPVYFVFFDEFSANISPEAHSIIDTAAAAAKSTHAARIRVEARASATGSADANMKLAETRAAVIRDALVSDGTAPNLIRLAPLGQMGTADTSVMQRRVTITLEK